MLKADKLTKVYEGGGDSFTALDEVSIEIGNGECVALVGRSGSGKSTLMHLLALLDTPSSGRVWFQGQDLSTLSQDQLNLVRNKSFGFIFQQFFLNGRDTVLGNVILPLKIRGLPRSDRIEKALEYLELVGLRAKANKSAKDLSGGEKQRVCIARALVGDPEIIFADEPTGNLDTANGEKIEEILFSLNRDRGIAIAMVTHDDALAGKCARAIELRDGQIVAQR